MAAARDELPAVARRRVRLALRSAREHDGRSQSEIALALGWSLSKLQRVELGEVSITPTDLRAALSTYGVTDEARIAELMRDARVARRERYWTTPEYRENLTPGMVQLLQFELAATAIREYLPTLIPTHLQTPAVAEAMLSWFDKSLSRDERRVRQDVRLSRRAEVIDRDGALDYFVMLDESVLWRAVGGPVVAAEQFEYLAEATAKTNVHVRVLPMDTGALMGTFGAFSVLDLGADPSDAVLYRESYLHDELVQEVPEVSYHRDVFERFWGRALDESVSRALILARAYDLRAKIVRSASADPQFPANLRETDER